MLQLFNLEVHYSAKTTNNVCIKHYITDFYGMHTHYYTLSINAKARAQWT